VRINSQGLRLLKGFEGLRLTSYYDLKGVLTIGYGHTGMDVYKGQVISEERALLLFKNDLSFFEKGILESVTVSLNENEFSALVSFTYNIGLGNFRSSTLLFFLNQGERSLSANQFLRWNHVNGIPIRGLTLRRYAEKALFMTPFSPTSFSPEPSR